MQFNPLISGDNASLSLWFNPNFSFCPERNNRNRLILPHTSKVVTVPAQMLLFVVVFIKKASVKRCPKFTIQTLHNPFNTRRKGLTLIIFRTQSRVPIRVVHRVFGHKIFMAGGSFCQPWKISEFVLNYLNRISCDIIRMIPCEESFFHSCGDVGFGVHN